MPDPVTFEVDPDSTDGETMEVHICCRGIDGNKYVITSFHMTKAQFSKFTQDAVEWFDTEEM